MVDLGEIHRALKRASNALPPPGTLPTDELRTTAVRLGERLQRDLLPRLATEGPVLLVAIAGPNNVGKSSLFNSVVGRPLSPARAEGGLTKQCLAAAHPSLWAGELRSFVEQRYDVVRVEPSDTPPVDQPGPPGRLYLSLEPQVPPGLLVMDTPDFDSVHLQNRVNSEALLVTVDLVLFVVSRQTYQNAALVTFLKDVVGHGKPYLVVYNEAARAEVAEAHLDKLVADVGHAPVGRYFAWHQPEVEAGRAFLETKPFGDGPPLTALLGQPENAAPLKAKALAASLRDASAELSTLAKGLRAAASQPERLRSRLRHDLRQIASRAATKAVPADVLIQAFREELDARSRYHRWIRMPFRALANVMGFVGRKIRDAVNGPQPLDAQLAAMSDEALRDGLRRLVDALGPELAAWHGDGEVRALLERALGPETLDRLSRPLDLPELREGEADRRTLHAYCRQLVANELAHGGDLEVALQTMTTLLYSAPASAAAVISVATGGFGHDAAVWAASALSTPLFEKLVDLLGTSVRTEVTKKWAEARGDTLSRALERTLFARLLEALDERVATAERLAAELDGARETLINAAHQPPVTTAFASPARPT